MKRFLLSLIVLAAVLMPATAQVWAENMDCSMCHPQLTEGKHVHAAVGMGCTACHSGVDASDTPHAFTGTKGLMAEPPGLCFGCHGEEGFSGKEVVHSPVENGL